MPEPKTITAGNSYRWSKSFSDYPASSWALAYSLLDEKNQYDIEGANIVADGDGFTVTLPTTLSTTFVAGHYSLIGYVTKGTERITVFESYLNVRQSFSDAHDRRSYWVRVLANVRAVLESTASSDVLSSTVEGDTLALMTPEQLLVLHDRAEREVARLKHAAKAKRMGRLGGTVRVRFN